MNIDYYSYAVEDPISADELELYNDMMAYRASLGLPAIPLSASLTTVAARHAVDTVENVGRYVGHSWSDAPYAASDPATYASMWEAPQRLGTAYLGAGYEISAGYIVPSGDQATMTADAALAGWQSSPGHDAVITNTGVWAGLEWQAIGVAIYAGVSHVWFGAEVDPAGAPRFASDIARDIDPATVTELPQPGATAPPPDDLSALRDFDGNDLGATEAWRFIGTADMQADGDAEHVYVNPEIGRWATVGPDADGTIDFAAHGQGGDTRVVGIYIDPLVESGEVERGSDFDSQRRFQNDLEIDNLELQTAFDFDADGFQEMYFKTVDGTAYLRALMHADGNIQYANYQSEDQVRSYLDGLGYGAEVIDTILV